jgi:hypothetical protein
MSSKLDFEPHLSVLPTHEDECTFVGTRPFVTSCVKYKKVDISKERETEISGEV